MRPCDEYNNECCEKAFFSEVMTDVKLADDVYVLPIPRGAGDPDNPLNLTLILDEEHGPTLVDTAFPDKTDAIANGLDEAGIEIRDLERIIITHQDLDHMGSAAALVRESGARVLAHPEDEPYIDGTLRILKLTPELLEQRPQMREMFERLEPVGVDEHIEDGDRLDLAGGIRVIFTPGHTPGHASLYLEEPKILIAGDALTSNDGTLNGPNPAMTLDMQTANESVERLAELDVETIICYHGGVVSDDASGQLQGLPRS